MKTEIISSQNPEAIQIAQKTLNDGGLIAFPTDTVYGVAAPINNSISITKLYDVKGRTADKAIPILIADNAHLNIITPSMNAQALNLAKKFWPGALTLILQRKEDLPQELSPYPTVGVRMPALTFTLDLILQCGPLATTSANLSGQDNPLTAQDVIADLGGKIELIIDGGQTQGGVPSTVVDCTKMPPAILREGLITKKEILTALEI